jgi:ATP-dependent Lon protease
MRTSDKYVNLIKMYSSANYSDRKELERSIVKEGDLLSFAILNYAIALTESAEKAKRSKVTDEEVNHEYISLLVGGFKFFKVHKLEEFAKLTEELMKETNPTCHHIHYHLQEYFLVKKKHTEDKINFRKYNKPLSQIELVVACSLNEYTSVDFDTVPLNLKANDIAIIKSRGTPTQEEVIKYYIENLVCIKKYLREGFLNLLYLVNYIDLKNLHLLGDLFIDGLSKEDLFVKKMVDVVTANPLLNKEKKEFLIQHYGFEDDTVLSFSLLEGELDFSNLSKELQDTINSYLGKSESERQIILTSGQAYESGKITHAEFEEEVKSQLLKKDTSENDNVDFNLSMLYSWVEMEDIKKLKIKDKEDVEIVNSIAENMVKPKISLTDKKLEQIEELKKELPNFAEMIDHLVSQVKLNIFHNNKMSFKPMLLLGNPGLGKTYVAKELARIFSTGFEFIDFASTSAAFVIKGGSKQWKDADIGKILKLMISSNTINPVVLYDEIDKNNNNKNYPPEVVLYQLFEPMNAKTFEDEYLGIKFDASSIINICTANSLDNMTKALESRMTVFEIQKLSVEENRHLIEKMYQKTISHYSIFEPKLSQDIIESMELFTPREIDTAINNIMAKNIQKLSLTDLMKHRNQNRLNLENINFKSRQDKKIGF